MKVFILGLTLIITAFLYLGFSQGGTEVVAEDIEKLPAEQKEELFNAFEKIAVKREVASEPSYERAGTPKRTVEERIRIEEELEAYVEERRDSIALARDYLANHEAAHSDEERREMEELVAELESAVSVIKVHMARTDSERAYDLEDRFDEVLAKFESMMKE